MLGARTFSFALGGCNEQVTFVFNEKGGQP
jgi:hypothetical protein